MKILMLLRTADGGQWAARLAYHLMESGVEIYTVLPHRNGRCEEEWRAATKEIFYCNLNIRSKELVFFNRKITYLRELVNQLKPEFVYSLNVDPAIVARFAFRKREQLKLIFHVPGPLHLENRFIRRAEIATAGSNDYWIASSQYIFDLYTKAAIDGNRLFLAYFGIDIDRITNWRNDDETYKKEIRKKYSIPDKDVVIMNISYFYPPKLYLGQVLGLKNHENMIRSMQHILRQTNDVSLILVGKQWGGKNHYEERLRKMAGKVSQEKIKFTGYLEQDQVFELLNAADLVLHVPFSENCGGIVEAALIGKPIIASNVGGLPEIVKDGKTGWLTKSTRDIDIAGKVIEVLGKKEEWQAVAASAEREVRATFEIKETSETVRKILSRISEEDY